MLRQFKRSTGFESMTKAEQLEFQKKGQASKVVPLNFVSPKDQSFRSFESCYKQKLKNDFSFTEMMRENDFQIAKDFNFIRQVENKYNCASFCEPSLFFITKDISAGKPDDECVALILKNIIDNLKPIQMVFMLVGVMAWVALVFSIMAWVNTKPAEDEISLLRNRH